MPVSGFLCPFSAWPPESSARPATSTPHGSRRPGPPSLVSVQDSLTGEVTEFEPP